MSDWKLKLGTIFASPTITRTINGKSVEFSPLRVKTVFELRELLRPIAKLIGMLMEKKDRDSGFHENVLHDEDGNVQERTIQTMPISPDIAKFRANRFDGALENLISTLIEPSHRDLLALVIKDSLRKSLGDEDPSTDEILDMIPLPVMRDVLVGIYEANKGLFGPFDKAVRQLSARAIASLNEQAGTDDEEEPSQTGQ